MTWWDAIVNYYKEIGERYSVDPVIFVGIHIIATPLFAAAVWWIIYNKKKHRSLVTPVIVATLVFNAANIYLIAVGKNIPWWIYAIVVTTTIISSYFTIKKVRKKLSSV
jgi:hypothetical protein